MAQEVFTQWIFLLPPISFGEFIVLVEALQEKTHSQNFKPTGTRSEKQLHFITGRCFPHAKGILFCRLIR